LKKLLFLGVSALLATSMMAREFKIGILQPMSGKFESFGKKTIDGINFIYSTHNVLPKGDKIKLVILDNSSDGKNTVQSYKKLANEENVIAVEGPLTSKNAIAIKNLANTTQTPTVTQIATAMKVTRGTKYISRPCFTDDFQGKIAALYALKHNLNEAVILFDISHNYSVELMKAFMKTYKQNGGKVLKKFLIHTGDTDFSEQLHHIKELNPPFIYIPIYAKEAGEFVKQLREKGLKSVVMGGDGIDDPVVLNKIAGKASNGVLFTTHFDAIKPLNKFSEKFVNGFKEKYKRLPTSFEATGADGYLMIYNALKKCDIPANKNIDEIKECVNDKIRHTTNLEGVTGNITINPNTGNPVDKPAVIEKIVDGSTQFVEIIKP